MSSQQPSTLCDPSSIPHPTVPNAYGGGSATISTDTNNSKPADNVAPAGHPVVLSPPPLQPTASLCNNGSTSSHVQAEPPTTHYHLPVVYVKREYQAQPAADDGEVCDSIPPHLAGVAVVRGERSTPPAKASRSRGGSGGSALAPSSSSERIGRWLLDVESSCPPACRAPLPTSTSSNSTTILRSPTATTPHLPSFSAFNGLDVTMSSGEAFVPESQRMPRMFRQHDDVTVGNGNGVGSGAAATTTTDVAMVRAGHHTAAAFTSNTTSLSTLR